MLKYYNYDVVFVEVPTETTLAINITNCPHRCVGCHSPWLQRDEGVMLTTEEIDRLMMLYGEDITCVCFMGGDAEPDEVGRLSAYIHKKYPSLKTAWYSGSDTISQTYDLNYIKVGHYEAKYGGLDKRTTNQRMYYISDGESEDITHLFWKK